MSVVALALAQLARGNAERAAWIVPIIVEADNLYPRVGGRVTPAWIEHTTQAVAALLNDFERGGAPVRGYLLRDFGPNARKAASS